MDDALQLKATLFALIVDLLSQGKMETKVYFDTKRYKDIPKLVKTFRYTDDCKDADILFVDRFDTLPKECQKNHEIFVTSYRDFIKHKDRIVGAFFWQKGRPTIIFNGKMLKRFGIYLPKKYDKYID